jgi:hypothetical protein
MSVTLSPEIRKEIREAVFVGQPAKLALHTGYFIMWFGAREGVITQMLAHVLGFFDQAQRLEFVVRGLDARSKCERLRQAAKFLKPLGPNLDSRLLYFLEKIVPLRNRIAHTWMVLEDDGRIHFTSIGKIHDVIFKGDPTIPSAPDNIHLDDFFDRGAWLHAFSVDLLNAMEASALHDKALEIDDPHSPAPK